MLFASFVRQALFSAVAVMAQWLSRFRPEVEVYPYSALDVFRCSPQGQASVAVTVWSDAQRPADACRGRGRILRLSQSLGLASRWVSSDGE